MSAISDTYQAAESSMLLLHKDMNTQIYGGGNVSHILNINIYQQTTGDNANQFRQQVFHKINNVPIKFTINNIDVVITWRSNAVSDHYHTDVMGMYGDVAVKLHTEMLLKMFDNGDSLGGDFMITKPLVRTIPLMPQH